MTGNPRRIAAIVDRFGGQSALARALGCRQSTVWEWVNKDQVPSNRIEEIVAAGRRVSPAVELEPNDFFAAAEAA